LAEEAGHAAERAEQTVHSALADIFTVLASSVSFPLTSASFFFGTTHKRGAMIGRTLCFHTAGSSSGQRAHRLHHEHVEVGGGGVHVPKGESRRRGGGGHEAHERISQSLTRIALASVR